MKQIFTCLALTALFYVVQVSAANAQKAEYGNISEAELQLRVYEKDTSAAAVILSDFGKSHFIFNSQVQLVTVRHTRIKILKKAGYDWANVEVPYYQKGSRKEKVTSVKGFTYNLQNGKVIKDKLESKRVFEEQESENWFRKKFTMPNVKEGSVIEFTYTITSDFPYNLREWYFQNTVPTLWSEYQAIIPQYFDYKTLQQGYQKIYTPADLGLKHTVEREGYKWIAKDIPALKEERFITTMQDYVTKIEFELERVHYPGEDTKTMTGTWEQVVKDLLADQNFGRQLNRSGFFEEHLAAISSLHTEPAAKAEAIYKFVQQRMNWNGKNKIYVDGSVKKAFDEREGSAADLNMLLTAMLQHAGFDASPVLVSTRAHGRPYKGTPLLNEFNYIVTHLKVEGKEILLDATDKMLPMGMLPERCLNGEGYVVKAKNARWTTLKPAGAFANSVLINVAITEDGSIKGTGSDGRSGYSALRTRDKVNAEGKEKYLEQLGKESGDIKLSNHSIINLEELDMPVNISFDITGNGNGENNSLLYLSPVLGFGEKENPFKIADRSYPVDFGAPHDETIVCNFILPDGWVVDEAPGALKVSLPDNGGSFTFMVQKIDNRLQVMSKVSLLKAVYNPGEYQLLKELFNRVVAKQAEQIVLKKAI